MKGDRKRERERYIDKCNKKGRETEGQNVELSSLFIKGVGERDVMYCTSIFIVLNCNDCCSRGQVLVCGGRWFIIIERHDLI